MVGYGGEARDQSNTTEPPGGPGNQRTGPCSRPNTQNHSGSRDTEPDATKCQPRSVDTGGHSAVSAVGTSAMRTFEVIIVVSRGKHFITY